MRRPRRWWLTFLWTLPADVVTWVLVLLIRVLWGARLSWLDGLWVELRQGSLLDETWGRKWLGFTLGHGGILAAGRGGGPGADTTTERHELVHTEQFEVVMLIGFVMGLVCAVTSLVAGCPCAALTAWLLVWLGSWPMGYVAAAAQAYLRGENPYTGNAWEESAYAQTDDDKGE